MQFLAARSLCTNFSSARYDIPLAIWRHIDSSFFWAVVTWKSFEMTSETAAVKYSKQCGPYKHTTKLTRCFWLWWVVKHAAPYKFHVVIIGNGELCSVFPEVGQQTAVGHEGHHNIGRLSTVNTHSHQPHHIGMVELRHLQTFFNQTIKFTFTENT